VEKCNCERNSNIHSSDSVDGNAFQITISNNLIIYRRLKNSNIEHEKFIEEIISQLLNEPEPKAKKKTKK